MAEVVTSTEAHESPARSGMPAPEGAQPVALRNQLSDTLSHAVERLAARRMPVLENEAQSGPESPTAVEQDQNVAEKPADKPAPAPKQQWSPEHQASLIKIIEDHKALQAQVHELAAAKEEALRYKGIVEAAQAGDLRAFAKEAGLEERDMLDALSGDGKAPVSRPYVRRLENEVRTVMEKMQALEREQQARAQQAEQERVLANIASQLQQKSDYAILKQIPNAEAQVLAVIQQKQAEARERGEVAPALTVDDAAAILKGTILEGLKKFIADDTVRKELGLGESVTPDPVKAHKPQKALTSRMTAQGGPSKPRAYDPQEHLKLALHQLKRGLES